MKECLEGAKEYLAIRRIPGSTPALATGGLLFDVAPSTGTFLQEVTTRMQYKSKVGMLEKLNECFIIVLLMVHNLIFSSLCLFAILKLKSVNLLPNPLLNLFVSRKIAAENISSAVYFPFYS